MKQFDTIIIGGGLGGLTTGAQLAKQGKKVLLLEQHYIPGGCATTFKRKSFVMEVGLHEMDGLHPTDPKTKFFKELEIFDNIELIRLPELYRTIGKNYDIVVPDDTKKAIAVLSEKFPNEVKGIKKYFKVIHALQREIEHVPNENWKTLLLLPLFPILFPYITVTTSIKMYLSALINPLFLLVRFPLIFWKHRTIGSLLDSCIKNEDLKKVLLANLSYYHDDPHSMSLIYYSAAQGNYYKGGYFIKGGSQKLSNYLSSVITNHGGTVLLGKKVSRIKIEHGKATGVCYQDAFNKNAPETEVLSNSMVANAAMPLIADMLPQKHRAYMKSKIEHLEEACSLLSIYIGFNCEVKDLGNHAYSTAVSGDDIKTTRDIEPNMKASWEHRSFLFVDYSQIDSGLAPKGKSFGAICTVDYISDWELLDIETYKDKKEEVAQVLFRRLEKVIPGIVAQIEHYEVGTSKTIRNFTSNPKGTPYGFAQLPKQAGVNRRKSFSDVHNLYFASAWGFPGGGFTGAILSGIRVALLLNKRFKTETTFPSAPIKDNRTVSLVSKKEIAENTMELSFEKPEDFDFRAGQYAVLDLMTTDDHEIDIPIRPLTIASHSQEDTLKFVMRLSDSCFKKTINDMEVGDQSRIFGPMGDFTLTTTNEGIVFLISGIGITPVLSFLKELENNNFDGPIFLIYSNKTEATTAYHAYFKSLDVLNFNYIPVFTSVEKRIDKNFLFDKLKNFDKLDFYVVGTDTFVKSMKDILISSNVKKEKIKVDSFG